MKALFRCDIIQASVPSTLAIRSAVIYHAKAFHAFIAGVEYRHGIKFNGIVSDTFQKEATTHPECQDNCGYHAVHANFSVALVDLIQITY